MNTKILLEFAVKLCKYKFCRTKSEKGTNPFIFIFKCNEEQLCCLHY